MLTRIVSFYFANVPQSVVSAQAAVFRKFGQPIEQIRTTLDHGPAIDQYIRHSKFDVLLIFDIDCIPLNEHVVPEAIDIVANRPCLYGLRQNSNSFAGGNDLVGRRLFLDKAAEIVGHSRWVPAPAGAGSLPTVAPVPQVPVCVISLPDAEGRRRTITARLNAAGVPFRFVDA